MNESDRQYLIDLAAALDTTDRIPVYNIGVKEHTPEGARRIEISDKLAEIISKTLLDIVARDIEDERKKSQST